MMTQHIAVLSVGLMLIVGGLGWLVYAKTRTGLQLAIGWTVIVIGGLLAGWGFFDG